MDAILQHQLLCFIHTGLSRGWTERVGRSKLELFPIFFLLPSGEVVECCHCYQILSVIEWTCRGQLLLLGNEGNHSQPYCRHDGIVNTIVLSNDQIAELKNRTNRSRKIRLAKPSRRIVERSHSSGLSTDTRLFWW